MVRSFTRLFTICIELSINFSAHTTVIERQVATVENSKNTNLEYPQKNTSDRCRRCGRKLKSLESKQLGFGSVCYQKYLTRKQPIPLFKLNVAGKEDKMIRDKQIEEMAKIICLPTANKGNCEKCGFKKHCSKFDDATDLYNAGYRKSSEGKWLPTTDRLCAIKCGACGEIIDLDSGEDYLYWNYCPICGAKMKYESEVER